MKGAKTFVIWLNPSEAPMAVDLISGENDYVYNKAMNE